MPLIVLLCLLGWRVRVAPKLNDGKSSSSSTNAMNVDASIAVKRKRESSNDDDDDVDVADKSRVWIEYDELDVNARDENVIDRIIIRRTRRKSYFNNYAFCYNE